MADNNAQSTKQQNDRDNAARQGAEAVRAGAQAAQQGGQAGAEAIRRTGDVAAEATRRGGEAGAQAAQRAGAAASETVQRSAEAVVDSQRVFVQQAAERFQDVSQKIAEAVQGTTEDVRALMVIPNSAQGGLRDLQQSVVGLVEGVVRTNLRATQELFQLANPGAFVELQQRFAREYLDALMQGTATLVRATRRTADETLRPLEQQIEQRRRQQQDSQGQGFWHAAE
jgi:hypothetical protein